MYFGVFVREEFFERLPKEAAACRCVARLQSSIPWGDRRVGCPAQSHLPAKGEAAQGKQVGSEKCVCVCVCGGRSRCWTATDARKGSGPKSSRRKKRILVIKLRVLMTCVDDTQMNYFSFSHSERYFRV